MLRVRRAPRNWFVSRAPFRFVSQLSTPVVFKEKRIISISCESRIYSRLPGGAIGGSNLGFCLACCIPSAEQRKGEVCCAVFFLFGLHSILKARVFPSNVFYHDRLDDRVEAQVSKRLVLFCRVLVYSRTFFLYCVLFGVGVRYSCLVDIGLLVLFGIGLCCFVWCGLSHIGETFGERTTQNVVASVPGRWRC